MNKNCIKHVIQRFVIRGTQILVFCEQKNGMPNCKNESQTLEILGCVLQISSYKSRIASFGIEHIVVTSSDTEPRF